jgi:hypothetical protein
MSSVDDGRAMPSMLDTALAYAKCGFSVLPVKPGGKRPLTAHGVHDATTDAIVVRSWWKRWSMANIGVACGASGIVVLDLDEAPGETVQRIRKLLGDGRRAAYGLARTPRGRHSFWRAPNDLAMRERLGNGCTGLLPGFDVLAGDRYCIVPPSSRPEGSYEWLRAIKAIDALPEVPESIVYAVAQRSANVATRPAQRGAGDALFAKGSRDTTLFKLASMFVREGDDDETVFRKLEALRDSGAFEDLPGDRVTDEWILRKVRAARCNANRATASSLPHATHAGATVVNLVEWSDVPIEPVTWLLDQRLPLGELTLVEGDGGIGKTTLVLDWIARLSIGKDMPDGTKSRKARSLIIAEEDRKSILKARLLAAGADLGYIDLVDSIGDDRHFFTLPDDANALLEFAKLGGYAVVLVDALFNHLAADVNAKTSGDVRRVLRPLVTGAHEASNTAFVGIRHWTKNTGSAKDRGLGSIDLRNIARSVLSVGSHPDQAGVYVIARSKSNYGREATVKALSYRLAPTVVDGDGCSVEVAVVDYGPEVEVSADAIAMALPVDADAAAEGDALEDCLFDLLANGPRQAGDVVKEAMRNGFKRPTIYRAAKRMGWISRTRRGQWELPPELLVSTSSHLSHAQDVETSEKSVETTASISSAKTAAGQIAFDFDKTIELGGGSGG